jgi:hypothetical protein
MKSMLLAGAIVVSAAGHASAQSGYWVVGNSATGKCDIVTSNPVITSQVGGNTWFGTGPFQSNDDAKLARSNISQCPPTPETPAQSSDQDKQQ